MSESNTMAPGALPAGWVDPLDPVRLQADYKYYAQNTPSPGSFEQYVAMVRDAHPSGRPLKPSATARNPEGDPLLVDVTDQDLALAAKQGYDVSGYTLANAPFQKILDNVKTSAAKQQNTLADGTTQALGGLTDANKQATQQSNDAINALTQSGQMTKDQINALIGGLQMSAGQAQKDAQASTAQEQDAYSKFGTDRDAAAKAYLDQLAPLQKQLTAQGYTGASTSASDINRLLDSYASQKATAQQGQDKLGGVFNRYSALSNPEMTAKEQAILDAANNSWSMADKSARDADAARLQAQGVYSGGAAIAQQALRGQQLGQDRRAATVAAQGSAVDRALQALAGMQSTASTAASTGNAAAQGLSQTAGNIRTGNDAMAQFNAAQQGITQRFQDTYAQDEAKRAQGLAQAQVDTGLGKTAGDFTAAQGLHSDQQNAIGQQFNRVAQTTSTGLTGATNKLAVDQGVTGDKITAANNDASRAANLSGQQLNATSSAVNLQKTTTDDEDAALKALYGIGQQTNDLQINLKQPPSI